ncbi:MAG: hypothetical protein JXB19_08345 [Bacteroidales bacterium]|nr:hypothetical protein [Bacteroidales bacterium]
MLENLLKLIQENADEAIIKNPVIPNSKNNAVIKAATTSIFNSLRQEARSGDLEELKQLLQNQKNVDTSPVVKNVSNSVAGDLMKKFSLNKGAAAGIVSMLLPIVMSKLVQKTNDPKDNSFNLDGILGSLLSGKSAQTGGIMDVLKGLLFKK